MTSEEFWSIITDYQKGEAPVEVRRYDEIKQVFIDGLPEGFLEEYDIGEVITELTGHNANYRQFDRLREFLNILKENYPELYEEYYYYFGDDLLLYGCYKDDEELIKDAIAPFYTYPSADVEFYFFVLYTLIYYGRHDLMNDLIINTAELLKEDDELTQIGWSKLHLFQLYLYLEDIFVKVLEGETINLDNYPALGYEVYKDLDTTATVQLYERALPLEQFDNKITLAAQKGEIDAVQTVFVLFLKYARNKHIPFLAANIFGEKLIEYWNSKKRTGKNYFEVHAKSFHTFIEDQPSMFEMNSGKSFVVLWLSTYFYDFLFEYQLINERIYHDFKMIHANVRAEYLEHEVSDLWLYDFVHRWEKPDSWSEEWWINEKELFANSVKFTKREHREMDKSERDLENILPSIKERGLHKYKVPSKATANAKLAAAFDKFLNLPAGNEQNKPKKNKTVIPSRPVNLNERKPKIGRNTIVTVKYKDGKIKKDIKYKKVQKDVESGQCKVIKR